MKINKLSPNFEVRDIRESITFYEKNFGFKLIMAVPESKDGIELKLTQGKKYVYAMLQKDDIELMFQESNSFKEDIYFSKELDIGATVSFYMNIEGIDEFYNKLKEKNLEMTDIKTTWYGMKEFYVKDINGYILGFAEKIEVKK